MRKKTMIFRMMRHFQHIMGKDEFFTAALLFFAWMTMEFDLDEETCEKSRIKKYGWWFDPGAHPRICSICHTASLFSHPG